MSHLIWQESGCDHTLSFFSVPDTYGDYVTTVSCNETPMPKYLYSTFQIPAAYIRTAFN